MCADPSGVFGRDRAFRVAGAKKDDFGAPVWGSNQLTLTVENERIPGYRKEVWLLVDYTDQVAGRQENIMLMADGVMYVPAVTASPDGGQLLFYWGLPYQPGQEQIIFPGVKYNLLNGDVKDWNLATYCSGNGPPIPEPTGVGLVGLVLLAVRRRRA